MKTHYDVIIIGAGPAGISAAIWCKRLGIDHILLEKENKPGGQLSEIQNELIDYPGLYAANGEQLLAHFQEHMQKLRCNIHHAAVTKISTSHIYLHTKAISFHYLIVATGSSSRKLFIEGEENMIKRGEVYSATKDKHLFANKHVIVVGGGDRAFEGAYLLADAGAIVTLIHRSARFRAREALIEPVLIHPNITVRTNTTIVAIHGENRVEAVTIQEKGHEAITMKADAVFTRIGVKPNSELLAELVSLDENGYIVTDTYGRTTQPNIFAIGDVCNTPLYSSISLAVGQAMKTTKYISLQLPQKM